MLYHTHPIDDVTAAKAVANTSNWTKSDIVLVKSGGTWKVSSQHTSGIGCRSQTTAAVRKLIKSGVAHDHIIAFSKP